MPSSIKFSFSKQPATSSATGSSQLSIALKPPAAKQKTKSILNQFNDEDDDDGQGSEQTHPNKSDSKNKKSNPMIPISSSKLSRQQKIAQEEATQLDPNVYKYDEVYDVMKLVDNKAKLEKDQKGAERKPQYISGLIETAKQRKIDRVRAEDKMVQRERELEGEEFANKDEFVTPAYLEQQKELREAEQVEKLKAEQAPNKQAMTNFYQNILEQDSKRNEAAVKAVAAVAGASTSKKASSSGISLGLSTTLSNVKTQAINPSHPPQLQSPQYDPEPEGVPSEAKLAAEIGKKLGRNVDLDDEGRIVDHRQLLTGGLNLGPPKALGPHQQQQTKKKIGFALPISERRAQEQLEKQYAKSQNSLGDHDDDDEGLSQAEKIKLSRERQSILLQQQLIDLDNKKRKAEEDSKLENLKKVVKRNDQSKIEILKQQALKRRQERQEGALTKDVQIQASSST
ncbi:hypothetical protein MJO28_016388 [Puccinia striiformis f. sp. tritici]|uniref:Uncharacterized protein n=1 Tax=Puccinia striiformis f. sp. tritici TaxID=168172 RepID=A0ACC0DN37_9BASI|nr:hypothetical protein MJO28_016388 [Puccinia striiformis f. sp. tritici]